MVIDVWTRSLQHHDACNKVNHLPEPQRCRFVRDTADCRDNMYLINYLTWHYCHVDSRNMFNAFWSMLAMTVFASYIFWMMQISVGAYFCPTLKVLADTFRMNENVAGVTLLTIANGSSDLFTAVAGMLVFSKWGFLVSMTQSLFQHTFVAGMVILTRPFYVEPCYFLRDFGFLFLNTAFMDFIHKRESGITKLGAIPGALIYLVHVFVAVIDQRLLTARVHHLQKIEDSEQQAEQLEELKRQTELGVHRERIDRSASRGSANRHLFQQFWESLFRFDKDKFRRGSFGVRFYLLVKEPMEMLLRLLVPVVDVERPNHGWSKLLCCLQFIIAPTYIFFILLKDVSLLGTAAYIMTFYIMLPLGCLIFWRTRTDTTPKFFRFTAILGLIAVIFLIFFLTSEVMAMFFTIGTIWHLSQSFVMATAICWAINAGDLVASITLARQGFPRMAYAATFSSPVFGTFVNLALPLALETTVRSVGNAFTAEEGSYGETACIFVEVGLVFTLMSALTTNFQMRRACGMLLVAYYLFFLAYLLLLETDVIHAYGVDD
ncbi:mitochondrial sodium/calcium exchanger protein isoform X1 [Drosophila pseudoobscura]|uniref:Mitochondrial sodium/calcium exchanger protein isoform X1 n=1 Tax=Drosophila pseudoobscura pseudoobscura TaxID=46245 RepID=A0A6I8UUT5_DROPS|nr:mitochondrial sodium/calcium exchanger protein isoform X1 [Drosophila pseudoobscura]